MKDDRKLYHANEVRKEIIKKKKRKKKESPEVLDNITKPISKNLIYPSPSDYDIAKESHQIELSMLTPKPPIKLMVIYTNQSPPTLPYKE